MKKFSISPSGDYPFAKNLLILCTTVFYVCIFFIWYSVIFADEHFIVGIAVSCAGILVLYACLLFVNYDISFDDESIVITNWLKVKRKYRLDSIDRVVYKYYVYTTLYVVYYDKNKRLLFKTKYGKPRYLNYLESIGFQVKTVTKMSMLL